MVKGGRYTLQSQPQTYSFGISVLGTRLFSTEVSILMSKTINEHSNDIAFITEYNMYKRRLRFTRDLSVAKGLIIRTPKSELRKYVRTMHTHTEKYSIHRIGVGGLCEHKNKILLVKISYGPSKGKWILPGGLVERKETLSEAVEREVLEETGIRTKAKELLSARHMVTRTKDGEHASDLYLTFRVQYLTGDPQPYEGEVAKAEFIAFRQLGTLRVGELVRHVIEQTASKRGPPKTSYQPSSAVKRKLKVLKYELYA